MKRACLKNTKWDENIKRVPSDLKKFKYLRMKMKDLYSLKWNNKYIFFVLLLTAIIFSNTIGNDFVNWDDEKYIHENPYIKDLSIEGIKRIFTESYFGNYYPITTLSYAIEYSFFELNPKIYHITNYLIHLINTL